MGNHRSLPLMSLRMTKVNTYTTERDKTVRKALRLLAQENNWEVLHEINGHTIYKCR